MLGTCGEYIISSTNTTDDIVKLIKTSENINYSPFIIKKIGIKCDNDCELKINNKLFYLSANEPLEFGYDVWDITSIISATKGVKMVVRYLY